MEVWVGDLEVVFGVDSVAIEDEDCYCIRCTLLDIEAESSEWIVEIC